MAKQDEQREERRRRERTKEEKVWSKEERENYEKMRSKLRHCIWDVTTPPPKKEEKEKDFLEELFG